MIKYVSDAPTFAPETLELFTRDGYYVALWRRPGEERYSMLTCNRKRPVVDCMARNWLRHNPEVTDLVVVRPRKARVSAALTPSPTPRRIAGSLDPATSLTQRRKQ